MSTIVNKSHLTYNQYLTPFRKSKSNNKYEL